MQNELLKGLVKRFGDNIAVPAVKMVQPAISSLATGVFPVDFALRGGWPRNRLIEVFGPESAGKTTLALMSAAEFQRQFAEGVVWYVDAERTFDMAYAKSFGIASDRFTVVFPDYGEQAVDIILQVAEDQQHVETLLIIDSIAHLVPMKELEQGAEYQQPGIHARLIHRLMRGLIARTRVSLYSDTSACFTVLALNQIREQIGVMFGNPETTPGGRGLRHAASVRLRISAPKSKLKKVKVTKNGVTREVISEQTFTFGVPKNKTQGPQNESGEFTVLLDTNTGAPQRVLNGAAILRYGVYYGVIKQKGTHYYYRTFSGQRTAFTEWLIRKPQAVQKLSREIVGAVLAPAGRSPLRKETGFVLRKA